ncbi:MAG: glycosyltransferase family 39 protein [Candidatus Yanofskybacteria bacterium]|nr:glycosyltransferase family 39 protein [Candidatus Yanofskybacteria bacterium]
MNPVRGLARDKVTSPKDLGGTTSNGMKTKFIAGTIIISATVLAISSVWNDSPIVDEIPHIGAGYSYIQRSDFRLNPEHPPLAKDLAGFALSFLSLNQSTFATQFWTSDINGQWNFGRNLIFNSRNDAILMTRVAKIPMILFFILSAVIIFHWTKKLYGSTSSPQAGDKAALIATFLFSFSPTVLAHSRFVTTDVPALFGVLLGTYFFIKFLQNQTKINFTLAFVAFGIAQLTKFSLFLLNPLLMVIAIAWGLTHSTGSRQAMHNKIYSVVKTLFLTSAIIVLGYLAVVWPVYGLHVMNYPVVKQKADTTYYLNSYGNKFIADKVVWASNKPYLRALAHYGTGVLMVTQRSIGGNTTYFLGEVKQNAWKKYFPIVYFIKEPLAFWGLVIIALLAIITQVKSLNNWTKSHFTEFAMLTWLAIYWYASIRANLNIGVRHLMPTYGFVYILLSGQIMKIIQNAKIKMRNYSSKSKIFNFKLSLVILNFTLFALFGWYLFENLRVYPYYLTYFNQVAGGPKGGYLYVVDSNVDWGQDLKRLADWVNENRIPKISLDYFGWADAGYYLGDKYIWINAGRYKNAREFLADNPVGGYIAVSKSFFMGSREKLETSYAWLDAYTPVADIGNSIFVWHITQ